MLVMLSTPSFCDERKLRKNPEFLGLWIASLALAIKVATHDEKPDPHGQEALLAPSR
jgi:hypothetical protein